MDVHFCVLGIPRGCDEVTMKKAYRQKALALHPDRNPNGAEQFKKVGEAYEALRTHFRLHGGKDVMTQLPTMRPSAGRNGANPNPTFTGGQTSGAYNPPPTGGAGFQYARRPQPFNEDPPHLFTESGAFGYVPGGFARERQAKGPPRSFSEFAPSEGAQDNVRSDGPSMSSTHERANERWRRAHGDRVPLSGYSNTRGDNGVASMKGAEAAPKQRHQSSHNEEKPQTSQQGTQPFSRQSYATNARSRNTNPGKHFSSCFTKRNGRNPPFSHHNINAHCDDSTPDNGSIHSSQDAEMSFSDEKRYSSFLHDDMHLSGGADETLREIHREWSRLEKDMNRKMENLQGSTSHMFSKEAEDYVVRKAASDKEAMNRRKEHDRVSAEHAKSILDERLMLKKVLFTQLYTPDPADVALMPDSDVFVLCELIREVGKNMGRVLEGRMKKGLCARCSVAAKSQRTRAFTCSHPSVCEGCAETCGMCPVCGAGRR